jgi:hypothetical protein
MEQPQTGQPLSVLEPTENGSERLADRLTRTRLSETQAWMTEQLLAAGWPADRVEKAVSEAIVHLCPGARWYEDHSTTCRCDECGRAFGAQSDG